MAKSILSKGGTTGQCSGLLFHMETGERKLWRWTLGYSLFLLSFWPIETWIAERWWVTASITYMPQWIFLIPLIPTLWLARKHRRVLLLAAGAAGYVLLVLMEFRFKMHPRRGGLSVLVYNIAHAARGEDGLARVIEQTGADILIFQESSITDDLDRIKPPLKRALKNYEFVPGRHLLIASKYPILERRTHPLQPERDKYMHEATINVRGTPIRVFNLHLQPLNAEDVLFSAPLSLPSHLSNVFADRLIQVKKAREAIDRWDGPAIIAGDLNGPPKGLVYQRLAAGFVDAQRVAGLGLGYTKPSEFPMSQKDYLLSRGFETIGCEVLNTQASDHRPLLVWLKLGQPPNLMRTPNPSD